jgi:hypothetical protein
MEDRPVLCGKESAMGPTSLLFPLAFQSNCLQIRPTLRQAQGGK